MSERDVYAHVFRLEAPVGRVFGLFSNPGYLDLLTPPWFRLRILGEPPTPLQAGVEISYSLRWRHLPFSWTSRLTEWNPCERFTYVQVKGPYRDFRHEHVFKSLGDETEVTDVVYFSTPGGRLADKLISKPDLRRIFAYRERAAARMLSAFGDPARRESSDSPARGAAPGAPLTLSHQRPGDPSGLDPDLAQHARRRHVEATEVEARGPGSAA